MGDEDLYDDLAEAFDTQEAADAAPAKDKDKDEGFAGELKKVWEEREEGAEAKDEFSEMYAPYKDQLTASGITPAGHAKMLFGVAQRFETDRDYAAALFNRYHGGDNQQPDPHGGYPPEYTSELERFTRDHPDADSQFQNRMGRWMADAPKPTSNETIGQALERSYRAVKGLDRAKASHNKDNAPPNQDRRDDIEATWNALGHGAYMRGR